MTVFDMADEIWVPNRRMQELYKIYGGKLEPYIHPNATDLRPIENRDERVRELYRDYGITENETVFLFVGRLIERKNIFFIARALGILKQKCEKAFKMIYVGAGPDEERLRSLIKDEGIEENVIISGRISDRAKLADFYAAADLFLFPSLYDTNSLVQIEAASQGTPTLFLRDSVTSSSIEEDVSGYIAEDSVDAYAEKMLEIMNKSPENKAFVRENVVKDVYKHWEELVIEMLERFVELADSKSARRDLSYEEIFSDFFLNTKNKNRPDFDEIKRLFQKLESRGKSDIEAAMKAMWESFK
jgi:glycosyltransferase involved in cell wall biosynthesis